MNILCAICSDLVNQAENIDVTKCGHVFHHHCLAQWIARSKSCPQCRHKVTKKWLFRIYPTVSNETNADDAATLQSRLDDAQLQLRQQKASRKELDDKLNKLRNILKKSSELIQSYKKKLASRESAVAALNEQLNDVKIQNKETNRLKEENDMLHKKIQALEGALCESESKKNELRDTLHSTKQQLAAQNGLVANLQATVMQLKDRVHNATRKYEALQNKRKAKEMSNESVLEVTVREDKVKLPRLSDPGVDLDTAMLDVSPNNLSTMVRRIESADSPYLNLKQSSVALALAHTHAHAHRQNIPDNQIKPSEFAIINSARSNLATEKLSIFHKNQPVKPDPSGPTPKQRPVLKCVPKVTAKHKLKRPNAPTGNQDIAPRRELRSSVEQEDTPMLLSTGRKQRISRVQSNSQQNIANMMSKEKQDAKQLSDNAQVSQTSPLDTKTACAVQKTTTPEINNDRIVSYADLDLLTNDNNDTPQQESALAEDNSNNGGSLCLLCQTIAKYGVQKLKYAAKAIPEKKVKDICNKLDTSLAEIVELPHELYQGRIKELVEDIKTAEVKQFVLGFIQFLRHPDRKIELFSKTVARPGPPMTKNEQVLLYVIDELQKSSKYEDVVSQILANIEYALFALNKPAETFDVIEVMAHFYALLCRYYHDISKLRLFIADAMYFLRLKSVILVQQCLEVWMFVLPLGHMGLAKCPLVTCLVYLLHFYKCEDKFNRVRDIRNTLRCKYHYDFTDWSESQLLEHFKTAVTEIKDIPMDRKLLRMSLLILAKRNGAPWCQNNIVKDMLQPLINDPETPDSARRFAISMLGPLLRPYPANMKVHCETTIEYLLEMMDMENPWKMQEAIVYSLMSIDKNHKINRLHRFLAGWIPEQVSPDFEEAVIDYVRSTELSKWKTILSRQI